MKSFNKIIEYVKSTCWADDTDISIVIEEKGFI